MKAPALILAALFGASPITTPPYVVDGDTIHYNRSTVRIVGIDAPELGNHARCNKERELAALSRAMLAELLHPQHNPSLRFISKRDKYGRKLAHAFSDHKDVAAIMIETGMAAPYTGRGPKKDWCELKISALDLGVVTGVCFGFYPGSPRFMSWNLRAEHRAERGLKLMIALQEHLNSFNPEVVYLEAPANLTGMVQRGTSMDTLASLYGYDMLCRVVAFMRHVRLESVDSQIARYAFLGFKPKKGEGKKAVYQRCHAIGWKPSNHNESDAAAVWSYGGLEETYVQLNLA